MPLLVLTMVEILTTLMILGSLALTHASYIRVSNTIQWLTLALDRTRLTMHSVEI